MTKLKKGKSTHHFCKFIDSLVNELQSEPQLQGTHPICLLHFVFQTEIPVVVYAFLFEANRDKHFTFLFVYCLSEH